MIGKRAYLDFVRLVFTAHNQMAVYIQTVVGTVSVEMDFAVKFDVFG